MNTAERVSWNTDSASMMNRGFLADLLGKNYVHLDVGLAGPGLAEIASAGYTRAANVTFHLLEPWPDFCRTNGHQVQFGPSLESWPRVTHAILFHSDVAFAWIDLTVSLELHRSGQYIDFREGTILLTTNAHISNLLLSGPAMRRALKEIASEKKTGERGFFDFMNPRTTLDRVIDIARAATAEKP